MQLYLLILDLKLCSFQELEGMKENNLKEIRKWHSFGNQTLQTMEAQKEFLLMFFKITITVLSDQKMQWYPTNLILSTTWIIDVWAFKIGHKTKQIHKLIKRTL
jgi:hypothetical protein